MSKEAELLNIILEDISEIINETLHEEDREGHEVIDKVRNQIDEVLKLREHEAPPDVLLRAKKRLNAFHLLHWKAKMELTYAKLKQECVSDPDSLNFLILSAFMLGVYRGNRFTLDDDEYFEFMDPLTHKKVSSAIATSAHKKKEDIFKNNIKEALRQAEQEWKAGSQLFHDQMTDKLLKEFPRIKNGLPKRWNFKRHLNRELKSIARKFNRVRGEKK